MNEMRRGSIAHDDRDSRTPRLSSSLELAELRAALARDLAVQLRAERDECERNRRPACRRPAMRGLTCQRMANDCLDFAREFDSWQEHDPGSEHRRELSIGWIEYETSARRFLSKQAAAVLEDVVA